MSRAAGRRGGRGRGVERARCRGVRGGPVSDHRVAAMHYSRAKKKSGVGVSGAGRRAAFPRIGQRGPSLLRELRHALRRRTIEAQAAPPRRGPSRISGHDILRKARAPGGAGWQCRAGPAACQACSTVCKAAFCGAPGLVRGLPSSARQPREPRRQWSRALDGLAPGLASGLRPVVTYPPAPRSAASTGAAGPPPPPSPPARPAARPARSPRARPDPSPAAPAAPGPISVRVSIGCTGRARAGRGPDSDASTPHRPVAAAS